MLPPVLDTRNDQGCRCFVWQIEIDDGRHPVDIDAAGGNVGGDGVGRSAPRAGFDVCTEVRTTLRWRKADSNRWSHFDRDAFQNTILGS
jgi:hypothetical protein